MTERVRWRGWSGSRSLSRAFAGKADVRGPARRADQCCDVRNGRRSRPLPPRVHRAHRPAQTARPELAMLTGHGGIPSRIRLGPELSRLTELEPSLFGKPDCPGPAQEGHLLRLGRRRPGSPASSSPRTARASSMAARSSPNDARRRPGSRWQIGSEPPTARRPRAARWRGRRAAQPECRESPR